MQFFSGTVNGTGAKKTFLPETDQSTQQQHGQKESALQIEKEEEAQQASSSSCEEESSQETSAQAQKRPRQHSPSTCEKRNCEVDETGVDMISRPIKKEVFRPAYTLKPWNTSKCLHFGQGLYAQIVEKEVLPTFGKDGYKFKCLQLKRISLGGKLFEFNVSIKLFDELLQALTLISETLKKEQWPKTHVLGNNEFKISAEIVTIPGCPRYASYTFTAIVLQTQGREQNINFKINQCHLGRLIKALKELRPEQ